jgi:signal transduction histidine kinase
MEEEQRFHFLSGIIKETERLSHLITQVLNLEKYESGRQKLNLTPVLLNALIKDSIQSVSALALEKKISISTRIPDSMFLIRCDADLIQQVMNNLLSNAIKFVEPQTGQITVAILPGDDEIQVSVEDNGRDSRRSVSWF